jgi:hypothetical protein
MIETLNSQKYKEALEAARLCTDPETHSRILDVIKASYKTLLECGEGKDYDGKSLAFTSLLSLIRKMNNDAAYEFVSEITKNIGIINLEEIALTELENVHHSIWRRQTNRELRFYEEIFSGSADSSVMNRFLKHYFFIGVRMYSKEKTYDIFSVYYRHNKLKLRKNDNYYEYGNNQNVKLTDFELDERWFDLFTNKSDAENLVNVMKKKQLVSEKIYKKTQDFLFKFLCNHDKDISFDAQGRKRLNSDVQHIYSVLKNIASDGRNTDHIFANPQYTAIFEQMEKDSNYCVYIRQLLNKIKGDN